jgi:hypothetical protein
MKNEGKTTSLIEQETRRLPSLTFLGLALGALGTSAALVASGKKRWGWGLVAGQWGPVFLLLGIYNKIAKTFSAPYSEEQRLRHGDHAVDKPNEPQLTPPAYS